MDRRRDRNIGTPARKSPLAAGRIGAGLMAASLLALSGCSDLGSSLGIAPKDPAVAALACPKISIVRDLSEVAQFRPGGRDLTELESVGKIADYYGNCDYTSTGVTVNVNVLLYAERGPALKGDTAAFKYFVAVAQPDDTILTKTVFDTSVTFASGQPRGGSREELTPTIPLPKGANVKDWNARDWKVYVGFQLSPEQLEFNRKQAAAVKKN